MASALGVLVTGANGFLGRRVVSALRSAGHRVRVLVRPGQESEILAYAPGVEVHAGDLAAEADLAPACDGMQVVLHLAGRVAGDPVERMQVAVRGTTRVLDAMAKVAVRRLVLASSLSVYGVGRPGAAPDETTPRLPEDTRGLDPYTRAKLRQEALAWGRAEAGGISLTVLRPARIWGAERGIPDDVVGRRAGGLLFVVGPRRTPALTYVENCAEAFVRAAERADAAGRAYDVVDGDAPSAWQLAAELTRSGGLRVPVPRALAAASAHLADTAIRVLSAGRRGPPGLLAPVRMRTAFPPQLPVAEAARRALGWRPRYAFAEALARSRAHATEGAA